jgi:hypothetical protein
MFDLIIVQFSVYLVPVDEDNPSGNVYINNTTNHETYNIV